MRLEESITTTPLCYTRSVQVTAVDINLGGLVLVDATTGAGVDLGAGPPLAMLTVIRHRY